MRKLSYTVRRGDTLTIAPVIPKVWPGFRMRYRHKTTTYEIAVENPAPFCRGVASVELDGTSISSGDIPLLDDQKPHTVRVVLGTRSGMENCAADPMALASVTSQVFLGVRMACAQCHNHPFDTWTRKQFYDMAAYFGKTRRQETRIKIRLLGVYLPEAEQTSHLLPPEPNAKGQPRAARLPGVGSSQGSGPRFPQAGVSVMAIAAVGRMTSAQSSPPTEAMTRSRLSIATGAFFSANSFASCAIPSSIVRE